MNTSKFLLGLALVGAGVFALVKIAKGAGSLFDNYMNQLATFSGTRAELEVIRYSFEADWLASPPKLTQGEYTTLYNLYLTIYNSLP